MVWWRKLSSLPRRDYSRRLRFRDIRGVVYVQLSGPDMRPNPASHDLIAHRLDCAHRALDMLHRVVEVRAKPEPINDCARDTVFSVGLVEYFLAMLGRHLDNADSTAQLRILGSDQRSADLPQAGFQDSR